MKFRSSYKVFKPKSKFLLPIYHFFKQYYDFERMTYRLNNSYYSFKKSKNTPYNPTSMLRLFFVLNLFAKDCKYSSRNKQLNLDSDLIKLCGFNENELPTYTTYYYFLKRVKLDNMDIHLSTLNRANVLFAKFLMKNYLTNSKHKPKYIVLAIDSKPIATDGRHPRGAIHSHNLYLNGKLGIKLHTLSIVYPFLFPIAFTFTTANRNDSPWLRKIIPIIAPISELNIPIYLTADKGYYGYQNIDICQKNNVIPIISPRKNSKKETYDKFFYANDKIFCIYSNLALYPNGYEKKQNRLNFRCSDKSCTRECSHRVWIPLNNFKTKSAPKEYFNIMKSYLNISVDNLFKTIYDYRTRIELLHGIWTKSYSLRNTIYLRDIFALNMFEKKLISNIMYDILFNLNCSPLKFLDK